MRCRSGNASTCLRMARQPLAPQDVLLGIQAAVGHIHRHAGLGIRLVDVDRVLRPLVLGVARVIHRQVGRNAIQPGVNLALAA